MKYLKRYNESKSSVSSGDLDFDTFKEIMYDLSDYFECILQQYSDDDNEYYECVVKIKYLEDYVISDDNPVFNFDYLSDTIPDFDGPNDIKDIYADGEIYRSIDNQSDKLAKLRSELDTIIDNNNKIKDVFKTIEEHIVPRLETFNNHKSTSIGFDSIHCELLVSFDIR